VHDQGPLWLTGVSRTSGEIASRSSQVSHVLRVLPSGECSSQLSHILLVLTLSLFPLPRNLDRKPSLGILKTCHRTCRLGCSSCSCACNTVAAFAVHAGEPAALRFPFPVVVLGETSGTAVLIMSESHAGFWSVGNVRAAAGGCPGMLFSV
jgi:hypothetical protein